MTYCQNPFTWPNNRDMFLRFKTCKSKKDFEGKEALNY